MLLRMKLCSSYSCVSTSPSPPFQRMDTLKLNLRPGLFDGWNLYAEPLRNNKDFLILFFTEALFYCGVASFLFLVDCLRRPLEPVFASTNHNLAPHLGNRITFVAVLVLSLTVPMVTMGFVWPWTGPAAFATLVPYLVGIIVQFAFEQYANTSTLLLGLRFP